MDGLFPACSPCGLRFRARTLVLLLTRAVARSLVPPQIAVDNGFGGVHGRQKADWMVDVVQQYLLDNGEGRIPTFGLPGGAVCARR